MCGVSEGVVILIYRCSVFRVVRLRKDRVIISSNIYPSREIVHLGDLVTVFSEFVHFLLPDFS